MLPLEVVLCVFVLVEYFGLGGGESLREFVGW